MSTKQITVGLGLAEGMETVMDMFGIIRIKGELVHIDSHGNFVMEKSPMEPIIFSTADASWS